MTKKAGWNYRVVKRTYHAGDASREEDEYGVYEAYYREDGSIYALSEDPVSPHGETMDEFRDSMEAYSAALEKPVLDYDMKFGSAVHGQTDKSGENEVKPV